MLSKTPLTVFLSNLAAGLSRISKDRNVPNANGIKAGTFANYIAEANNFKNSNELSAKLDDYVIVHKSELPIDSDTHTGQKILPVTEIQAEFVSQWAEGFVRSDCTINLETLEITNIEVVDQGDNYEHLEKEYVSIKLGDKYYEFEIEEENHTPKICEDSKATFEKFLGELKSHLQITLGKEYSHHNLSELCNMLQLSVKCDGYGTVGESFKRVYDLNGNFVASFVYSNYSGSTGAHYKCIWVN